MVPEKLYKYMPSKYVDHTVSRGKLLFRNFTYFRQTEGKTRGDYLEAHHRDNPDHDITITNMSSGQAASGDFSFLNSTNSDVIFMFCTSKNHDSNLYEEFEADACIEIKDVPELLRRMRMSVMKLIQIHKHGLLHRDVTYYEPSKPSQENIKDATVLPFLKDSIYAHQGEYRMVFGRKGAFKLKQQIVANSGYDFRAAAQSGMAKEKLLTIGSIEDLVEVHFGI